MSSVAGRLTASARVKYSAGRMPGSTDIKAAPALGAAQGSAMWAPQIAVCWWCLHNLTSSFSASWQGCKPHLNHSSSTSQRLKDEARELLSLPAQADILIFLACPALLTQPCSVTPHRCCCQHHLREVSQQESQQITALLLPHRLGANWNVALLFQPFPPQKSPAVTPQWY